jgi:hypothetical protein
VREAMAENFPVLMKTNIILKIQDAQQTLSTREMDENHNRACHRLLKTVILRKILNSVRGGTKTLHKLKNKDKNNNRFLLKQCIRKDNREKSLKF